MLEAALVGTGGMMPLPNRFLSSMLCRVNGSMILIDSGEGTQVSLKLLGWGFKNIDIICFTHFHADHISGLPGLLLTIGNTGREEPLRMFGPPGLQRIVESLRVIAPELPFDIIFYEWEPGASRDIALSNDLTLRAFPVYHGTPCFAYSLTLGRRGKFDLERAKQGNVPMKIWSALQKQNVPFIVYNDIPYTPDMVLGPPRPGLKLAYCTDTRPKKGLAEFAFGADLLICEGLYGEAYKQEKAAAHKHMTFAEAAKIAKDAQAEELWLTHFSPALPDPKQFLSAAAKIFPNTVIGRDRMTKTLRFIDDDD